MQIEEINPLIGAILVPVNPSLRVNELSYLYKDAGIIFLISSVEYIHTIREARQGTEELKHIILTGESVPDDAAGGCPPVEGTLRH
jgi:acyl-CoA synthetase (AMP-forming)/AMP-acid ligase II